MDGLEQACAKMKNQGADDAALNVFRYGYQRLQHGDSGLISEDSISPLQDLPQLDDDGRIDNIMMDNHEDALHRTVLIKLNGGLGTSMGMEKAKSLLPVRDNKRFFDIICDQVRAVRRRWNVTLPLIFMNSFRTRSDTLHALADHPDIPVPGIPMDFLQNQEPKLRVDDLTPISWPDDPQLEWCPPGHGDIYPALYGSGLLKTLIDHGYRYAMVSNSDNLGASPSAHIAAWFATCGAPFAMEVCKRTHADRKGGHLAIRNTDGRIILREAAQVPADDRDYFMDEKRHRYFNTNTLWLDIVALYDILADNHGVLHLPLIRNVKNVDPTDGTSPAVIQLETAMGTAIETFEGASAIEVPRSRFLPVKTTSDLLLVSSDVYHLDSMGRLNIDEGVTLAPEVTLDERFYRNIDDYQQRFSKGTPSLKNARSFRVDANVFFGANVSVIGDVCLDQTSRGIDGDTPLMIPDGTELS